MDDTLKRIEGTWEIVATNFPMWTSGKNHNPQISYSKVSEDSSYLTDTLQFEKNDKIRKIIGRDLYQGGKFIWRGKGILKLLKSEWSVIYLSDDVLMIEFEKSMVTPSGIDVLVRKNSKIDSRQEVSDILLKTNKVEKSTLDELLWLN
ncbi:hypothetical protein [Brochothrix thermosphacta]|uniref:hypothetical protein n=1 Tax=Brochothrix thermosphacta TaxID=2756 RepID=UPI001C4E9231|nr:hypothetical protein [Brochothrix thermosphacta]